MKPKVGDKILIARPGYYPMLIRARIQSVSQGVVGVVIHYSGESYGYRRVRDEGVAWCRGHDLRSPQANALRTAVALASPDE